MNVVNTGLARLGAVREKRERCLPAGGQGVKRIYRYTMASIGVLNEEMYQTRKF